MAGKLYRVINKFMVKWFGRSWENSLYGLLAVIPQAAKPTLDYMASVDAPARWCNLASLFFSVCFVLTTKGHDVTGGKA